MDCKKNFKLVFSKYLSMNIFLIISYLSLFIWLYLLLLHGRSSILGGYFFWSNNIIFEKLFKTKKLTINGRICVIIPARNEEKTILKTLFSIKDQGYKNLEIIVINDNSSDQTAVIVNDFKKDFKKITLINGKKLPRNWAGKTWALKQAVDYANKKKFTYYMFVDSDIIVKKGLLINIVSFIQEKNYLMVSLMAKLNCHSNWEKFLIPSFIFFFQKLYPFDLVNKTDSKVSAAAGGFIFCRASIFKKENPYNRIKNKLIDDCNLAKLIKKKGAIWLGLTNQVTSERRYEDLKSISRMVSRTAFEQLGHSVILLFVSVIGMFLIYLFPSLMIILTSLCFTVDKFTTKLLILNLISFIIMLIVYLPTIKFYKIKIYYTLALPFSAFVYVIMTLTSAFNHFLSSGNTWKGRRY